MFYNTHHWYNFLKNIFPGRCPCHLPQLRGAQATNVAHNITMWHARVILALHLWHCLGQAFLREHLERSMLTVGATAHQLLAVTHRLFRKNQHQLLRPSILQEGLGRRLVATRRVSQQHDHTFRRAFCLVLVIGLPGRPNRRLHGHRRLWDTGACGKRLLPGWLCLIFFRRRAGPFCMIARGCEMTPALVAVSNCEAEHVW